MFKHRTPDTPSQPPTIHPHTLPEQFGTCFPKPVIEGITINYTLPDLVFGNGTVEVPAQVTIQYALCTMMIHTMHYTPYTMHSYTIQHTPLQVMIQCSTMLILTIHCTYTPLQVMIHCSTGLLGNDTDWR
jgi:hypothetical protein